MGEGNISGHRDQTERAPKGQSWKNSHTKKKIVLDYNPECKRDIHESTLV